MTTKLLLDEYPLLILPTLAVRVGLNESIVLQQVHYWLLSAERNRVDKKFIDGRWWTYGTYIDWHDLNFPFWSVNTIGRIFRKLEKDGYLLSRKPEANDWNQTKWYTIEYTKLVQSEIPDWNDGSSQVGTILNESETSAETSPDTKEIAADAAPPPVFTNSCAWCGGIGMHEEVCDLVSKPTSPIGTNGLMSALEWLESQKGGAWETEKIVEAIKRAEDSLAANNPETFAGISSQEMSKKKKPKKPKPRDPRLDEPSIQLYRTLAKLTPSSVAMDAIQETVQESTAEIALPLVRWEKTIREWLMKGYNPRNISGMLEVYRHGWKQSGHAPKPAQPVQYAEEH